MKILEFSIFKGIPFLAFLSFPAGLYFFNSSSTKQVGELGGLTARVNLFLEGNGQVGASQSSVSSVGILGGGGTLWPHNDLSRIFKVSEENKESTQSKKPILRAEFYLKNMERESYWKYCVVNDGKNLFKKSTQEASAATTSTSSSNSTTEECKWKYLYETEEKDYDSELIKNLLRKMYQFWRVEHVFNMLALYQKDSKISTEGSGSGTNGDIKITWEENSQTMTTSSQQQENSLLKKIKDNCDLKTEQTKDSLDVLFLSPDLKKKSCLPSPVLTNITLRLGSVKTM